jgi:hypothetical protein
VFSPPVLSSFGLPLPPTCLVLTVSEARRYFASTIQYTQRYVKLKTFLEFVFEKGRSQDVVVQSSVVLKSRDLLGQLSNQCWRGSLHNSTRDAPVFSFT